MDPATLGLISMGIGGAVKVGADLFDNTAGAQADLMRQQANGKLSALEENMRRTEGQQTQVLSSTKARMAGTGFASDSDSFTNYITTMADQFTLQDQYTESAGRKSVDLMMKSADMLDSGGALGKVFKVGADIFGSVSSMAATSKVGA